LCRLTQEKLVNDVVQAPERPVDDVIEDVKSGEQITKITVHVGSNLKAALWIGAMVEDKRAPVVARSLWLRQTLSMNGESDCLSSKMINK
jgi:hypothetical protein